jgi:hypothetical protein
LLASRVDRSPEGTFVPRVVRAALAEAQSQARQRHAKALRDLADVDACLRQAGIAYILVKGPVLTQQIYDEPGQRRFFDLDLIVGATEVDAAERALERLGYHLWGVERYLRFTARNAADLARGAQAMRAALRRVGNQRSLVTAGHRLLPIDLHWHLMPHGRMRAEASALWSETQRTAIGGVEVDVLAPEAALLHLAMHAWCNRPWDFALLHLVDCAWALQRLRVDWRKLLDLARRWGALGDLQRALHAIQAVLGVVPPQDLIGTDAAFPPRSFARLATAEVLVDQHALPEPTGRQRIAQRLGWGLATHTLRSSTSLFLARYAAVLRHRFDGSAKPRFCRFS